MKTENKNTDKTKAINHKPVLYAVLKLLTSVEVIDIVGSKHKIKISGLEGYIPVFKTKEEAEIEACDGKYQIFAMTI